MINFARSLLLNLPGSPTTIDEPTEEPIPVEYAVRTSLPAYLQAVRRIFFGAAPDRGMLLYRTRQLLTLLHATEIVGYLSDFDTRITYSLFPVAYPADFFLGHTARLTGAGTLTFYPDATESPDETGTLDRRWQVAIAGGVITATMIAADRELTTSYPLSAAADLAQLALPGTSGLFQLADGVNGSTWQLTKRNRPTASGFRLLDGVLGLSEEYKSVLFGIGRPSPYTPQLRELRRIVDSHFEMPQRLAAAAMALVYRMESP